MVGRTSRLSAEYEELKTDLLEEVNMVDERMIKPAIEAKEFLQPLKKTIKKREDKKVRDEILLLITFLMVTMLAPFFPLMH